MTEQSDPQAAYIHALEEALSQQQQAQTDDQLQMKLQLYIDHLERVTQYVQHLESQLPPEVVYNAPPLAQSKPHKKRAAPQNDFTQRINADDDIKGFGWLPPEQTESGKLIRRMQRRFATIDITLPSTAYSYQMTISIANDTDPQSIQIAINGTAIPYTWEHCEDETRYTLTTPPLDTKTARLSFLVNGDTQCPGLCWVEISAGKKRLKSTITVEDKKPTLETQPQPTTQHQPITVSAPVFIIGCPRSGTSALAWSVANHPDFWTSAESDFLMPLFGPAGRLKKLYNDMAKPPAQRQRWLIENGVSYAEFARYVGHGIDQLFLSRSNNRRWIDQSPAYTLFAEDLCDIFPEAQFLHAVRDGRRVVNSMLNSGFPAPWATDFEKACQTWVHYVQLGQRLQAQHPGRVYEVRNENLISDPETATDTYLDFLNATPSDQPATFLKENWINSSFGDKSSTLASNPWDKWDTQQQQTFQRIAGATMTALGYA